MPNLFTVTLNGTDTNPFLAMGLTQNPFPQVGKYELSHLNQCLAKIAGTPCPTREDLIRLLTEMNTDQAFIDLCLSRYIPGKIITFGISIP